MERVFLGWQQMALEGATEWLSAEFVRAGRWDLSQVIVGVPGSRVGRRLSDRLAEAAVRRGLVYFPPKIVTGGQLPEYLYEARRPFATMLGQHLAWSEALRASPTERLAAFLRHVPTDPHDSRWIELAQVLNTQHTELAANRLDFREVAARGMAVEGFRAEQARWNALADIQGEYLAILDRLGLWDRQTARLFALTHHECACRAQIVLLGMVDMNETLRSMLDQLTTSVTALVYADESWAEAFDRHGCVVPEIWRDRWIPLREDDVILVDDPATQAAWVADQIVAWDGTWAAAEMVVGVPAEDEVATMERALDARGIPCRYGPGRSVEGTRPVRLARAWADLVRQPDFEQALEFLTHPDVSPWLARVVSEGPKSATQMSQKIAALRSYVARHLPRSLYGPWLGQDQDKDEVLAHELVTQLLHVLLPFTQSERRPREWEPVLMQWLQSVYGDRVLNLERADDRAIGAGLRALLSGLEQLAQVPEACAQPLGAWQALLMAVGNMQVLQVPEPPRVDCVELLGWLELAWDDAPALLLTQMNEGNVPTSSNGDLFLPDSLRSVLGLDDNQRRFARDAYTLQTLVRTRRALRVVVTRRDRDGYPILPSRLLLAVPDDVRAPRCVRFFGDGEVTGLTAGGVEVTRSEPPLSPEQRLVVPAPWPGVRLESLNVTDFGAYLACPYRFYLRRVLGVQESPRLSPEMDAGAFGSLLHQIVESLGRAEIVDCEDPQRIEEFLMSVLTQRFEARFGSAPRPAIAVQRRQMELRLRRWAQCEAKWRRAGWRTVQTEASGDTKAVPWFHDWPVRLRGRLDRLDWHAQKQILAILDYKSGDTIKSPIENHHGRKSRGELGAVAPEHWLDLQLPLYRYLVPTKYREATLQFGYIGLPKSLDSIGFLFADWRAEELAAADRRAAQIVQAIVEERFWPPAEMTQPDRDAGINRICQWGVFEPQWDSTPLQELAMNERWTRSSDLQERWDEFEA